MSIFKEVEIIMLPTGKEFEDGDIILNVSINPNPLFIASKGLKRGWLAHDYDHLVAHHLYGISNEDIKEGDYYINGLGQVDKFVVGVSSTEYYKEQGIKKIIATTDSSLFTQIRCIHDANDWDNIFLPKLSQQLIENYIESHNRGESIIKILVEYEDEEWFPSSSVYGHGDYNSKVKINSDNTISHKELKENWSREEQIFNFNKLVNDLLVTKKDKELLKLPHSNNIAEYINNWVKENL